MLLAAAAGSQTSQSQQAQRGCSRLGDDESVHLGRIESLIPKCDIANLSFREFTSITTEKSTKLKSLQGCAFAFCCTPTGMLALLNAIDIEGKSLGVGHVRYKCHCC